MNKILLIAALEEIASREGHELNGQDKLVIRTKTAMVLAKQRHLQRMKSPPYQWRKPENPRR
jgi:hypothetical protein